MEDVRVDGLYQMYSERVDRLKREYLILPGLSGERIQTLIGDKRVTCVPAVLDMKGVDSNTIREKLQEVRVCIQKTAIAI